MDRYKESFDFANNVRAGTEVGSLFIHGLSILRGGLVRSASRLSSSSSSGLSGGAARMQKYSHLWPKASLDKAISRHTGSNHTSWVSRSGKTIYENPTTGRQVVVDGAGFFRIFQPKSFGSKKGVYLNMMGNVPAPATFLKSGQIKNIPLHSGSLKQATHFIIE